MRDLKDLPKAHLHLHLEGGMRRTTLEELSAHYGMEMPQIRGYGSFTAFSDMYEGACHVMQTPDDLRRLAFETVEDGLLAGAVYIEPSFYAPHHQAAFGDIEGIWEMMLDFFDQASQEYGVEVGIMMMCNRQVDPADAVVQAKLAAKYAHRGIVSLGLSNDEVGAPPELFVEAFRIGLDAGLLSAPHAGELEGPHFITGSMELLGAHRIQHGVRAFEQDGLVERIADSGITLDVCPTSNIMLSIFPSFEEHPLGRLLDAGVRCSVNGDDPLLFGPGLLEEYQLCRDTFGFDDERMATIARASIEGGGASAGVKAEALAGIDAWLAQPA